MLSEDDVILCVVKMMGFYVLCEDKVLCCVKMMRFYIMGRLLDVMFLDHKIIHRLLLQQDKDFTH